MAELNEGRKRAFRLALAFASRRFEAPRRLALRS
jgi:hypothetical protein